MAIAFGGLFGRDVLLSKLEYFETLDEVEACLCASPAWVGGFDLPFGLPRDLVTALQWPTDWSTCMDHYAGLTRADIRQLFKAFCDSRPVGGKFAHRATDGPAGSSPSMKWVNPPVAYMLHAGVPLLRRVNASFPGLHEVDSPRIALEAYPGLLIRELIGRQSYKSDTVAKQTVDRQNARVRALAELESGRTRLGLKLKIDSQNRTALLDDASGDSLDAVACLMQVAWAVQQKAQGDARFGWPSKVDPLEGWILTA